MRNTTLDVATATAFAMAMVLLGLTATAQALGLWLMVAAVLAAVSLAIGLATCNAWPQVLGLTRPRRAHWSWLLASLAIGLVMAVAYRNAQHQSLWPTWPTWFCLASMVIGGAEELAYRGFVQGQLQPLGQTMAILLAAAAHTAYKCSLFALPDTPVHANLAFLAAGTFAGGALFGLMRQATGSVVPPLLAHITFDAIVYGDLTQPPWWV